MSPEKIAIAVAVTIAAIAGTGPQHNVDIIEVNGGATPVGGIHLDQAAIRDVQFAEACYRSIKDGAWVNLDAH